jgi:hypothetical protein
MQSDFYRYLKSWSSQGLKKFTAVSQEWVKTKWKIDRATHKSFHDML